MYTYRFEEYVLRMLIGSNEEEVAARLGISAETVELIVENQLQDDKRIDPARVIKHVGMDEISLKKRHKLYVTVMTDLTDPESPKVLAVARGRDTAAALECLGKLTPEQRAAVEGINNKARVIYQTVLRGEVVGHALEPADPGPEPRFGCGGAEHRRATRDGQPPEGRLSRVLPLKPEEPWRTIRFGHSRRSQTPLIRAIVGHAC
ncbi:MAG: transposase [Thermoguttaceae bacterium]|nr:transposase [Thermoguttaceae bacterium]